MKQSIPKVLFDKRDYELLSIVNDVLSRDRSRASLKRLLDPFLHPHGIKEMSSPQSLRVAYAVINLLDSLEVGRAQDRINALRSLRDEVLHIVHGDFRNNTARVLLEIMKDLVRSHGDTRRQLELAHDFRIATFGKPRIIRRLLKRYHLLEMPEEWNQIAFDDHVHDVHTKGRKSAAHLIMDAWIKGIRHLTVIYYNYVRPEAVKELLEAAEIMGITARIGIEFSAKFRDRFVYLIWLPHGFPHVQDFLRFLEEPTVAEFLDESRKISEYQQKYVMAVLEAFNEKHRHTLNETYGLNLEPLDPSQLLTFVGTGQASLVHLGQFIHKHLLPVMQNRIKELRESYGRLSAEEQSRVLGVVKEMNELDSEAIVDRFLRPEANPTIPDPHVPQGDDPEAPALLKLSPAELTERLNQLHSGYRITLNLSDLSVEDVLELLYDCKGRISHLEIFNLKDYSTGKASQYPDICELQGALNEENVIALKRVIQNIINRMETSAQSGVGERVERLKEILRNIPVLQSFYKVAPLKSRIGSDSTGRSRHLHGMGLVVKESLPFRAQREIERSLGRSRQIVPIHMTAHLRKTFIPKVNSGRTGAGLFQLICSLPGLSELGFQCREDWVIQKYSSCVPREGNVATLGGRPRDRTNGLYIGLLPDPRQSRSRFSWKYLNTGISNSLKVFLGFIPAFATFALTKDWWLLAYFGAFIWFGITGLRNIVQSVLGGGGFRRSPLLRWNSYISWKRLSDSLLFTGFSVPLLDYLVKTVVLDRSFNITTATNPETLYAIMALAHGIYLSSHNAFRGLPRSAIFWNFFRSILSIPLAIAFNAAVGAVLGVFVIEGVNAILQKWAAIISKTASDCVAGVIEGLADRQVNIRMRLSDYETKMSQVFDTYAYLELLFPESNVLQMLESPKHLIQKISTETRDLEKVLIINALDLFYFWMYQPRARSAFRMLIRTMSREELQILIRSQYILQREREISQLFIDGLIGKKFSKALSLYLDRCEEYLGAINRLAFNGAGEESRHPSGLSHIKGQPSNDELRSMKTLID